MPAIRVHNAHLPDEPRSKTEFCVTLLDVVYDSKQYFSSRLPLGKRSARHPAPFCSGSELQLPAPFVPLVGRKLWDCNLREINK